MWFRFIGADYSMGLRYGKTYNIEIKSDTNYIWVFWDDPMHRACPYPSIKKFIENWADPKGGKL